MPITIVYGRGKTGQSLRKLLQKQGKESVFYDDEMGFDTPNVSFDNSTVLLSPGIKPNAKGIVLAKQSAKRMIGELQYCFPLCKAPCISVTGTNGKTTTCELIYHILKSQGKSTWLLGNGGVPFAEKVLECKQDDIVVLESSSFQLAKCNNFAPKVSIFTNLAVDHLDYHPTMADYSLAKQNNFVNQSIGDFALFNADDNYAMALSQKSKACTLFYSTNNQFSNCYLTNQMAHLNLFGKHQVAPMGALKDMYLHNQSNCLAAIVACAIFGVTLQQSLRAISTFKFLPHRMQVVANFDNVTFVDDSKGTNMHATCFACKSIKGNIALILGGSQKGYAFDEIFQGLPTGVKYICASGQTAGEIAQCGAKYNQNVQVFDCLRDCVKSAFLAIKDIGGTVLMSNACASFDKFSGYAQRGDCFQQVVEELKFESQL